jgi:hypothetical protein
MNADTPLTQEEIAAIHLEWTRLHRMVCDKIEPYKNIPVPPNPGDTLAPLGIRPKKTQGIVVYPDNAAPIEIVYGNTAPPDGYPSWTISHYAVGEYRLCYDDAGRASLSVVITGDHHYQFDGAMWVAYETAAPAIATKAQFEQERGITCTQEDGLITYSVEGRDANLSVIVDERARQVSGFTVKDTLMNGVTTVIDSEIETLIALLQTALRRSRYGRIARAKQA